MTTADRPRITSTTQAHKISAEVRQAYDRAYMSAYWYAIGRQDAAIVADPYVRLDVNGPDQFGAAYACHAAEWSAEFWHHQTTVERAYRAWTADRTVEFRSL